MKISIQKPKIEIVRELRSFRVSEESRQLLFSTQETEMQVEQYEFHRVYFWSSSNNSIYSLFYQANPDFSVLQE